MGSLDLKSSRSDAPAMRWWSVLDGPPPADTDPHLLDQPQIGLRIAWERRRLESWADASPSTTRSSPLLPPSRLSQPQPAAGEERRRSPEGISGTLPGWPRGTMAVRRWILSIGGQPLADAGRADRSWLVAHPDILVALRLAPWIRQVDACSVGDLVRALTAAVARGEAQWIGGPPQEDEHSAPSRLR